MSLKPKLALNICDHKLYTIGLSVCGCFNIVTLVEAIFLNIQNLFIYYLLLITRAFPCAFRRYPKVYPLGRGVTR